MLMLFRQITNDETNSEAVQPQTTDDRNPDGSDWINRVANNQKGGVNENENSTRRNDGPEMRENSLMTDDVDRVNVGKAHTVRKRLLILR